MLSYNRIPNGYEVRRDGVLIGQVQQRHMTGAWIGTAYTAVTTDGRQRFGPFTTLSLAAERLDKATEQK